MDEQERVVPILNIVRTFEELYEVVFLMELKENQFFYRYISSEAKKLASLDVDAIGKHFYDVYPNYIADHLARLYKEANDTKKPVIFEDKLHMESYDEVAKLVVMPLIEQDGKVTHFISYTEKIPLTNTSYMNQLTGLSSFHTLLDHLKDKLQTQKHMNSLAFCYITLHRKGNSILDVNDSSFEEVYILEFIKRMKNVSGEEFHLARIGAEFLWLVEENGDLIATLKDVQQMISIPFLHKGKELLMETSMGISSLGERSKSITTYIDEAYQAMQQAKSEKGNAVIYFDSFTQSEQLQSESRLEDELKNCIKNKELVLHFQPIVNATTGEVRHEALLRWFSSKLGPVPPDIFIVAAEKCGFIKEIDTWVIDTVCEKVAQSNGEIGKVSINLSTKTFECSKLESVLLSACHMNQIDPCLIELELTEHTLLEDEKKLVAKLNSLRKAGFTIAIDDFGMRHASFNYLRVLPVDKIKIDKAFVQNLLPGSKEFHIITSILALARKIGVKVTAEGVETKEQATMLMDISCDELQGYLFGKPGPNEVIAKMSRVAKNQWIELVQET
ncbi:hypothetical protein JCM9140_4225 [Halalkalibacter wakoensis JCM 9140]|uniref:EAL domain-containing protein n=1 Tax=Halalkalibacter wakoensis JCM 9140 TaxID=1236970 RepID=W4Q7S2_9BACI|nr:EAL domain-containing protein [Halalkalibacter wakoensis]GAE28037.1 hypothetical protein JCM9140_4225 [Halalkalibacter wakoensis JCM 9140]